MHADQLELSLSSEPGTLPVPTLTLTRLRRDDPGALALWAAVIARVEQMSTRLGGSSDYMKNHLWTLFAQQSPLLGAWAATRYKAVVGHAIGLIEPWNGKNVAWIQQVEVDAVMPREFKDQFLHEVTVWVREANGVLAKASIPPVTDLMMQSHRMTDAWAKHAGFDQHRVIFRREVR